MRGKIQWISSRRKLQKWQKAFDGLTKSTRSFERAGRKDKATHLHFIESVSR
ncbi:MAG: hypothetical protein LUQ38_00010 [Methanotrichaceae archaeon]|nr:hypothetical protein [Methanotrichaceae archaeon]MDD1757233.1 hypothetical protein [Methanotrichaceae archaeon]